MQQVAVCSFISHFFLIPLYSWLQEEMSSSAVDEAKFLVGESSEAHKEITGVDAKKNIKY